MTIFSRRVEEALLLRKSFLEGGILDTQLLRELIHRHTLSIFSPSFHCFFFLPSAFLFFFLSSGACHISALLQEYSKKDYCMSCITPLAPRLFLSGVPFPSYYSPIQKGLSAIRFLMDVERGHTFGRMVIVEDQKYSRVGRRRQRSYGASFFILRSIFTAMCLCVTMAGEFIFAFRLERISPFFL
ncbi:hypothetical protein F4774DRAFT_160533 [Daldinia eschscholtzii]|nr:hypothetical protein F4774DRAFT_160533 [Daldinia eschscholtzii]